MCGISGFCDFSKNFKKEPVLWEHILTDMHHTLAHRGSDSFGTYLDTHVGLSHARLQVQSHVQESLLSHWPEAYYVQPQT